MTLVMLVPLAQAMVIASYIIIRQARGNLGHAPAVVSGWMALQSGRFIIMAAILALVR